MLRSRKNNIDLKFNNIVEIIQALISADTFDNVLFDNSLLSL